MGMDGSLAAQERGYPSPRQQWQDSGHLWRSGHPPPARPMQLEIQSLRDAEYAEQSRTEGYLYLGLDLDLDLENGKSMSRNRIPQMSPCHVNDRTPPAGESDRERHQEWGLRGTRDAMYWHGTQRD
jgi:hypothetical protein